MLETPIAVRSKLPSAEVSIFAVMSQLADDHGAVNLSQGFPDFTCDPALAAKVADYINRGFNQYAPMPGVLRLREALSAKAGRLYGAAYDPATEITVTAGATEALFSVISAMVGRGDEVIVLEPCYDAYVPVVSLQGGTPVPVPLSGPDYAVDWAAVRRAMSPRTRLIVVNSPHNPTGAVLHASDLDELATLVEGTDVAVLSDEVYEHIVFDGRRHESVARHPGLRERAFVVGSFGKTFHTTGWKVGYCYAPALLTRELRRVHQFVTFAVNTPVQHAYTDMLQDDAGYAALSTFYQQKRDRFLQLLSGSRWRPVPSRGTYFQLLDYSAISAEADVAFARRLTTQEKVAAIPLSPFLFGDRRERSVLRFCFAKTDETLVAAADRLRSL